MEDSIFTKIIKGEVPCHRVYEGAKTLAFLDIHPVQPGMVLVVSKAQVANFYELPPEDSAALWQTVNLVAKKLKAVFPDKKKIAVQIEGLDVEHTHVKLFPIDSGEELQSTADMAAEPDHPALAAMAQKLAI